MNRPTEQPSSEPFTTACLQCDLVLDIPGLPPGSRASCPRCGNPITSHIQDGFERSLAFGLAAAILLTVACSFPFLAFERSGLGNEMTLLQAGVSLYNEDAVALSAMVFGFILVVPSVMLGTLTMLMVTIRFRLNWRHLKLLGRAITHLSPWSMVEVFVIGVIVSLIKLAAMATVTLGISFWAYVAFVVCFTAAFACIDKHDLWSAIEELSS